MYSFYAAEEEEEGNKPNICQICKQNCIPDYSSILKESTNWFLSQSQNKLQEFSSIPELLKSVYANIGETSTEIQLVGTDDAIMELLWRHRQPFTSSSCVLQLGL